jgi:hypothetical protein
MDVKWPGEDVDPRCIRDQGFTIPEKASALGGRVRETIFLL